MKRKNTTRSALLMSVISMLLCVSMLVGTTFAWFTDEVESGINTIAAGNLDVELFYGKSTNPETKVTADKELFTDFNDEKIELWEPGVVAYTNLKVANVGTLALKYQLSVNFNNMNYVQYEEGGKQYTLADALKVAVVEGGFEGTSRADAQALDYNYSLATFNFAEVLEQSETSDVYGIVIYWEPGDDATDNLFNMNNGRTTSDGQPLHVDLGVKLFATQQTYEEDSFGSDYDDDTIDVSKIVYVTTLEELQAAVDTAENGTTIVLSADIAGHVIVTQKPDVIFTIDGNGNNHTGTITVDGKSARYATTGLTIMNVNFVGGATTDAYIALGSGTNTNAMRYTNSVAVKSCTFSGDGDVAVKSYTGGDWNLTIDGCVVNTGMHSLVQVTNVEKGLKITNCEVYSKNGANLNASNSLQMSGCTFDVQGYAVRFGVNGSVNETEKRFVIANSTLNSAHDDGDTAIIFRDSSKYATLNLVNTEVDDSDISGNNEKTTILRNGTETGATSGIEWSLTADGTLTVALSTVTEPDANSGKVFEVGAWREAVVYDSNGNAVVEGFKTDKPANEGGYFCDRNAVTSLVIEEGITSIGSFAAQFPNLTGEVVIPASVTYIGQEAFKDCPITKLTFAAGGTEELCIAPGAFKNLEVEEIVLPEDRPAVHVHCWAFNDCKNLKHITFPANVTTFSKWTHVEYCGMHFVNSGDSQILARCTALETITFGSEAVKDMFFAAPYNTNNINAIGNVEIIVKE